MFSKNIYLPELVLISNDHQSVTWTNYWETNSAKSGLLFLSWNAGAGRLLVPENQAHIISDMQTAHTVIVSRGPVLAFGVPDAIELLFEDDSMTPFVVTLPMSQCGRLLPMPEHEREIVITAWTQNGLEHSWPAKYRIVDEIPYLQPWGL